MTESIKLDIVSDVVCPWCIIGYKRLMQAISELGVADKVDIEWQPFELNPHMPIEGEDLKAHIAHKYGSSLEDQKRSQERMIEMGEEVGFKFDYFDGMRMLNTRKAHVLLEYAKGKGKQTELNMRLVTAFFSDRSDISNTDVLLQELQAIGLDPTEAKKYLENDQAHHAVIAKERYWQDLGVSSVPTFVFNKKSGLSGAQPVAVFKEILTELLNR
ncbi:DsbA family oxidoreductase [Maribacter polysaccharolyticus]|uniref:DsbA family oxidoreductase n=1 Tax=Maribacter polysaccharolyticus TaxID=3020831 RepID=UPI00237FA7E5|nr:DsbA family oxidoreductase [Maribacter polysaccharolyticus]MDE3740476.1 DsbA family oxidoreductase [Maribacter polysaccharolyticus]